MALVSKLEDENRQLREELQQKSGFSEKSTFASSTDTISKRIFFVLLFYKNHLLLHQVLLVKNWNASKT